MNSACNLWARRHSRYQPCKVKFVGCISLTKASTTRMKAATLTPTAFRHFWSTKLTETGPIVYLFNSFSKSSQKSVPNLFEKISISYHIRKEKHMKTYLWSQVRANRHVIASIFCLTVIESWLPMTTAAVTKRKDFSSKLISERIDRSSSTPISPN